MRNFIAGTFYVRSGSAHHPIQHAFHHAHRFVRLIEVAQHKARLIAVDVKLPHVLHVAIDDCHVALEKLFVREGGHSKRADDVRAAKDWPAAMANGAWSVMLMASLLLSIFVRTASLTEESAWCWASIWRKPGGVDATA